MFYLYFLSLKSAREAHRRKIEELHRTVSNTDKKNSKDKEVCFFSSKNSWKHDLSVLDTLQPCCSKELAAGDFLRIFNIITQALRFFSIFVSQYTASYLAFAEIYVKYKVSLQYTASSRNIQEISF